MRKILIIAAVFMVSGGLAALGLAETKTGKSGEELFKEHCSACHPEGGNIISPGKTLRKADREAHNITNRADIVDKMRHPGKGMTSWSAATIPDKDAEDIAEYILKTFK
ncbi:MAG: c-type cytochrome [Nitrospirae bacterium]|nr:c-type cytochrome [Nitrospirota bacterium]